MQHQEAPSKKIEISKNHEYFFAICSRSSHSFVMVGVKDNNTRDLYHLFSIGKFLILSANSSMMQLYFDMLFSAAPARLRMETDFYHNYAIGEFLPDTPIEFSYKAYLFSEEKYQQFLQHVGSCDAKSSHIYAYQRIRFLEDEQNDKAIFKFMPIIEEYGSKPLFNQSASFNNTSNTCRNTAIDMTLDAVSMQAKDDAISNSFLSGLPYSGRIENGKLNKNFLVFPLPPQPEGLDNDIYAILKTIYTQLETIPKKCDDNIDTYLKFDVLKNLYTDLAKHTNGNINEISGIISEWETKHCYLIDSQRGFSFYSRTGTRKMLDELREIMYQKASQHLSPLQPANT